MLAFVPAAWLVGRLAGEGSTPRLVLAMLAGSALVYVFGTWQLSLTTGLSAKAALWAGVVPFLPGDALKLAVAVGLVRGLRQR
jgi:biotin transport system substrate-specific component